MRILMYPVLLCVLFISGCAKPPLQTPAYTFTPPPHTLNYLNEVKPILVKRCVVCHSCYNSPCQLKLSSWEGLERGVSKEQIYNAGRLKTMDPSRLFIDAHSADEWRKKGFTSVKQEGTQDYSESLMFMILDHKRLAPKVTGEYFSEAADLTCSENKSELTDFLKKHPNQGMPFGFPPLTQNEFNIVAGWLSQGAHGPSPAEQEALEAIAEADKAMLEKWESFFNNPDPKYQMTARYLYDHLFLAHITFESGSNAFYELVRSTTGPGQEIDIIPTVRPYDDPGTSQFYYRFRKIYSTIVYKTHMVFGLGNEQYQRVQELFIQPQWNNTPHLIGYDTQLSANPFQAYEQIPARARYQWLLDNVHYIIMTFIRGPVCKGQVALNVINDHFWLMFLDPDYDLAVKYPGFLKLQYPNLRMPGENGSDYKLFKTIVGHSHYKFAVDYYKDRQRFYSALYPDGLDSTTIWKGNKAGDAPVLTVFRHFDSASVHRGVLGGLPKTVWLVDYPLLERIYYSLVAGFDIYGTAGHQLATRLYMDALRIEGESYFIDLMPEDQRKAMMQDWNTGVKYDELHHAPALIPAGMQFTTSEPKREFVEDVVKNQVITKDIGFDQNYLPAGVSYPELPQKYVTKEDILNGFIAVSAPGVSFFRHVGNHNANLAWVRVTDIPDREDLVFSVVVDRWHDNVRVLFREAGSLNPAKDRADFLEGFVGSYPNYFYVVSYHDLPDFFEILHDYDNSETYISRLEKYGVNRANDTFWEVYDWFQNAFDTFHQSDAGIVDLNRYYYLARESKE